MVIDTSALVGILLGEPEAQAMSEAIVSDPHRLLSAFNAFETAVVVEARKGPAAGREFDLLLHASGISVVALTVDQVELARDTYRRFGKGRHRAGLNLGDCCSYALARHAAEPLLFKGNDFLQTDITPVAY